MNGNKNKTDIYNIPAKVYKQKIKIKIKEHCTIVIKK